MTLRHRLWGMLCAGLVAGDAEAVLPAGGPGTWPLSYLHTAGAAADPATRLGWGLGLVSLGVIAVITVLLAWGIWHRRRVVQDARALAVDRDAGGMPWIYTGVGISTVVLLACVVWTLFTIAAVAMPSRTPDLTIEVQANQWWWSLRYANRDSSRIFTTANEIHVPVGQVVRLELTSHDVIHSFWIPKLGGKMDVIPGQTNVTWLEADQPGVYLGQCGEYCGAQHAHMALSVVAQSPQDYAAWVDAQLRPAGEPSAPDARHGHEVFEGRCAACHAVRGGGAGGILGPDLTHVASRGTIAAGLLTTTPEHLSTWILDAQALKPGTRMPSIDLSPDDLRAAVAYLETLK